MMCGLAANKTLQRTGASRFAQRRIKHHRRLAPVADLCVRPLAVLEITMKNPFGNIWWIATHVEDLPPDEEERRWKEFRMP